MQEFVRGKAINNGQRVFRGTCELQPEN